VSSRLGIYRVIKFCVTGERQRERERQRLLYQARREKESIGQDLTEVTMTGTYECSQLSFIYCCCIKCNVIWDIREWL